MKSGETWGRERRTGETLGGAFPARGRRRVIFGFAVWVFCSIIGAAPLGARVFLIGIDGADWRFIDPLVASGRLPHFQSLLARGRQAVLLSDVALSPVTWTTIATGKDRHKHGIEEWDPMTATPPSTSRKTKAIWDILGERKKRVLLVRYLVTWPAPAVNGVVISKEWSKGHDDGAYPSDPFGSGGPVAMRHYFNRDSPRRDPPRDETYSERAYRDELRYLLAREIAEDDQGTRLSEYFLARARYDFFAVHFWGIDRVGHHFMKYESTGAAASVELRNVLSRYYEYIDDQLGRLLRHADEETLVVVLSDHGSRLNPERFVRERGRWTTSGDHRDEGVLLLAGPNIRAGGDRGRASVYDVTPTLLYLEGAPVGRDMDGRVLVDFIDERYAAAHPVRHIATHESSPAPRPARPTGPRDVEELEQLRDLGYLK